METYYYNGIEVSLSEEDYDAPNYEEPELEDIDYVKGANYDLSMKMSEYDDYTRKQLTKLINGLSKMTQEERDLFFKSLQLDATTDMLEAIKNLKKTPGKVWNIVIEKLKNVADLPVSEEEKKKFDFKKFITALLPLLGALAGTLLAIRQAEQEESKSEVPDETVPDSSGNEDPLKRVQNELDEIAKEQNEKNKSSIVLQLAKENKEDFSL